MQSTNPFEIILSRLDDLHFAISGLSVKVSKESTKQPPSPERLLDLTEAAQIVRKPVGTVRHYIHHRSLPATKIGKSYLIKLPELLKWVDDFQQKENASETVVNPMLENRKRYRKS